MKPKCDEITTAYLQGRHDVQNHVTREVFHFLESQLPPEHRQRILAALIHRFDMDPGFMALVREPEAFQVQATTPEPDPVEPADLDRSWIPEPLPEPRGVVGVALRWINERRALMWEEKYMDIL